MRQHVAGTSHSRAEALLTNAALRRRHRHLAQWSRPHARRAAGACRPSRSDPRRPPAPRQRPRAAGPCSTAPRAPLSPRAALCLEKLPAWLKYEAAKWARGGAREGPTPTPRPPFGSHLDRQMTPSAGAHQRTPPPRLIPRRAPVRVTRMTDFFVSLHSSTRSTKRCCLSPTAWSALCSLSLPLYVAPIALLICIERAHKPALCLRHRCGRFSIDYAEAAQTDWLFHLMCAPTVNHQQELFVNCCYCEASSRLLTRRQSRAHPRALMLCD